MLVDLNPLVPYIIGGIVGSLVTGLFTWTREYFGKKQQFRLDIIKNRLEVFSKLSNDYILLASALHEFHEIALSEEVPNERKFYYTCKFFFYYSKIAEKAGGFEFENRLSEEVVTFLVSEIINVLGQSGFNYEAFSSMIDLVTSNDGKPIRYNKFILRIDNGLLPAFARNVISNQQRYGSLMQYCKWSEKKRQWNAKFSYKLIIIFVVAIAIGIICLYQAYWTGPESIFVKKQQQLQPRLTGLLLTADKFYSEGNYEYAIALYDRALEINPNYLDALYNKGNALFSLGRYEEAIIWYDKSLIIEPDDRDILEAKHSAVYQLRVQNALDSSPIR